MGGEIGGYSRSSWEDRVVKARQPLHIPEPEEDEEKPDEEPEDEDLEETGDRYYARAERPAALEPPADRAPAVTKEPPVDCKEIALRLAAEDSSLRPVRGYALFADGFTEHWWLASRAGKIVDVTSLPSLVGGVAEYVALAPTLVLQSTCDALTGACHDTAPCDWCVVRMTLEGRGHKRIRVKKLSQRLMFDRLYAENARLRAQLALLGIAEATPIRVESTPKRIDGQ